MLARRALFGPCCDWNLFLLIRSRLVGSLLACLQKQRFQK